MAKLTNSDREGILSAMRPEIQTKMKKLKEELSKVLSRIIKEEIPEEVIAFHKKYPELITMGSFVYIDLNKYSMNIQVIEYPVKFFTNFWETAKNGDRGEEVKKLLNDLNAECEKARIVEKKIACILDNISTEKRLKDEFPEAYKAYERYVFSSNKNNLCDSIESVRSQLSTLKKE